MNDLGKRLNDLASRATTGVVLADPSITGPATVRSVRGRKRGLRVGIGTGCGLDAVSVARP